MRVRQQPSWILTWKPSLGQGPLLRRYADTHDNGSWYLAYFSSYCPHNTNRKMVGISKSPSSFRDGGLFLLGTVYAMFQSCFVYQALHCSNNLWHRSTVDLAMHYQSMKKGDVMLLSSAVS